MTGNPSPSNPFRISTPLYTSLIITVPAPLLFTLKSIFLNQVLLDWKHYLGFEIAVVSTVYIVKSCLNGSAQKPNLIPKESSNSNTFPYILNTIRYA